MHPFLRILPWFLFLFTTTGKALQPGNFFNNQKIPLASFQNQVYEKNIRTVNLIRFGQESSIPVIALNSNEQLQLSFDDLDGVVRNYKYTVILCDAGWKPTDLWPSEYISGYSENYINDYRFSFNTLQAYVHYKLDFPNENMRIIMPGNYLLVVYSENNPDKPSFTRQFMVLDQKVSIKGQVKMPMAGTDRLKKHEIGFTVETGNFTIIDPQRNLKAIILQNNRWDNKIELKPLTTRGNQIDYQYVDGSSVFYATNEFRVLDVRSVKYLVGNVSEINRDEQSYDIYLWPDKRRNTRAYVHEKDINGRYFIKTSEKTNADIEAEYVRVHFSLEVESAIPGADVYIVGMLNQWQFDDENRMRFNGRRSVYEKSILLKQGYYNYQYALLNHGQKQGNCGFFEGDFADTSNEYTILIYYRAPGARNDNLISIMTLNSKDFL